VLGKLELSKWDKNKAVRKGKKKEGKVEVRLPEGHRREKEKVEVIFGPDVKRKAEGIDGTDDGDEGFFITNG
jgi:hypothetical protein